MAAAADGPRLLSLIAVLLSTARDTLQRPEQLHTAASSLHPFSPCPATGDQLEGCWICGWCHSAEGAGVSTQLFLSVLPLGRAPGIALVLLLALMLVRLHTQNCSGSLLCCITQQPKPEAFTSCHRCRAKEAVPKWVQEPTFTPAFPVSRAEASLRPSEISSAFTHSCLT